RRASRAITVRTAVSTADRGSRRYAGCWTPGAMQRASLALVFLVASLLVSVRAGATTAADIPCDDPTPSAPCVFSGTLTVTPGSTLHFGPRAFTIAPSGTLTVGDGDSLTILAQAVRLQAGGILRAAPGSNVGANVTIKSAGDIVLDRSGAVRALIDVSADDA